MEEGAPKVRLVTAGEEDAGQRLDNFLFRTLKGVPKSHVYRLLRTGQVRVNKKRAKPDYRLEAGDQLRLPPVRQEQKTDPGKPPHWQQEALTACILYEDDRILVVNKPAGMAVHGGSGVSFGVIETLRVLRPESPGLELAHRLDRDTSGCLILAKRRSAVRPLHTAFRDGSVEKHYLALLAHPWTDGAREVDAPLEKNQLEGGERIVKVSREGKEAKSLFTPLQRFAGSALTDVRIYTGRTHQIRVHASYIGHPVAGDDKYGDREANKALKVAGLKRMFLHAHRLSFPHPETGERLSLTAPLDDELQVVIRNLGGKPV
ncbi:MAG TPA: 23S rRNA pseudouridine(955/2504/2580) synthase RluC [Gammaproteobacteria bacterium]|nr:23S rRNA pseudouridine(955/2504/2580) synthase RluC [Gammaproteobacteria bacterium]